MKFFVLVAAILIGGSDVARAENGNNPWREVVCFAKDSRNVQYGARGFRAERGRVIRQALRACHYGSERPSTCRFLRCRP